MMIRYIAVGLTVTGFGLSLTACDGESRPAATAAAAAETTQIATLDYPTYGSLEDMGTAAALVVQGNFVEVIRRTDEREYAIGGDPNHRGLPVAVWRFEVTQTLKGRPAARSISIALFDTDRVQVSDQGPVDPAAPVIVFLGRERKGVWGRAGGDQAVVDITRTGTLRARPAAGPELAKQAATLRPGQVKNLLARAR
jgi:hypothetical protein